MASPLASLLTPQGHLLFAPETGAPVLEAALQDRLTAASARGAGHALLQLGARYVTALCAAPDVAEGGTSDIAVPPPHELDALAAEAPPMAGAEYIGEAVLRALWVQLDTAFRVELTRAKQSPQEFLKACHPAWNVVGRVHFNLAENRGDSQAPFAFIATYTTRLSAQAKAQHLPLGQALCKYAGGKNQARLLSLLMPVQRAMVDAGEIYHPLRWTPAEAYQFLTDVMRLEAAGVALGSTVASASAGHRGRQDALAAGQRRAARFQHGIDARRRAPYRGGNQNTAHGFRWLAVPARTLGRGRSRKINPHAGSLSCH